jgi:TPR repeat protein
MKRLLRVMLAVLALGVGAARADTLFWADAAWYQGDSEKAIKLYLEAAARGDKVAQRRLGAIYAAESAIGPPDYAAALKWYRLAATQGDAEALDGLALLYRDGEGVPQDYAEALRLLRRAVIKGFDPAKYHLGQMYHDGSGVPSDDVHAYMWFSLGAAFDAVQPADARDAVARNMTKQQIAAAQKLAAACQLHNFKDCD